RVGPTRGQYHGLLQGIQRDDQGSGRHGDPGCDHGLSGQVVHVHNQIAAGIHVAQKGGRNRLRLQNAEQGKGRQGYTQTGVGHREVKNEGFERNERGSCLPHRRRNRPQHGHRRHSLTTLNRGRVPTVRASLAPHSLTMPSKRYRKAMELMDANKLYPLKSAVEVLVKFPKAKFNETVELSFRLGVDPKQSDQMVRGTVPLPHGSGKTVKVLVFAKPGAAADAARAAGAEYVGYDDLIKKCNEGWADFDIAIATPEAMSEVRKLGKLLGPRGLMPNPKTGTVTDDTAKAVREVKAGRVEFKIDKAGNVHV